MSDTIFQQSLEAAVEALSMAINEREDLENRLDEGNYRIDKLQEAVRGLSALCGLDYQAEYPGLFPPAPDIHEGLTEKVRSIFAVNDRIYFSAIDIRDRLKKLGFPIEKYSNALATIHTVLRRLYKAEEIKSEDREGKTYYYAENDGIPF